MLLQNVHKSRIYGERARSCHRNNLNRFPIFSFLCSLIILVLFDEFPNALSKVILFFFAGPTSKCTLFTLAMVSYSFASNAHVQHNAMVISMALFRVFFFSWLIATQFRTMPLVLLMPCGYKCSILGILQCAAHGRVLVCARVLSSALLLLFLVLSAKSLCHHSPSFSFPCSSSAIYQCFWDLAIGLNEIFGPPFLYHSHIIEPWMWKSSVAVPSAVRTSDLLVCFDGWRCSSAFCCPITAGWTRAAVLFVFGQCHTSSLTDTFARPVEALGAGAIVKSLLIYNTTCSTY